VNCDQALDLLTESLAGPLSGRAAADLAAHLAACENCRAEAGGLRRIWKELGRLADEDPGVEMTRRFEAVLAPRLAAAAGRRRRGRLRTLAASAVAGLEGRLDRWLPRRPLAQGALVAAALAAGVLIGAGHGARGGGGAAAAGSEIGELRHEVRSLSRLVTLSLLQQDSASERLRGVSFGRAASAGDDRVVGALLDTLRRDPEVNVRLAAVDALAPAVSRAPVRDRLLQELGRQSSPLVQIALVDVLLAHDRGGAGPRLLELAADPALDPTVRDYLRSRLRPLS
jgi:hypothetical protein